jgi:hypothetical protein
MSALRAFKKAETDFDKKGWDTIYLLLDVHGTVLVPNWDGLSTEFYPHSKDVLQHLSKDSRYRIIMWTCSKKEDRLAYKKYFEDHGIRIDYINENPEMEARLDWGDYSDKLYCSILLDDKAGFCANTEWLELKEYLGLGPKHFWSIDDGDKYTCEHPNNQGLYKCEGAYIFTSLEYMLENPDKFTSAEPIPDIL